MKIKDVEDYVLSSVNDSSFAELPLPAAGAVKYCLMQYYSKEDETRTTVATGNPCSEITLNQLEKRPMSNTQHNNAVESRTFVGNLKADNMSTDQLLAVIKSEEADITALKAVKAKSKKVAAVIKEKRANIIKIVELIDAE